MARTSLLSAFIGIFSLGTLVAPASAEAAGPAVKVSVQLPAKVWVAGHWTGHGRSRHWVPGHYKTAPRVNLVWIPGHWTGHGRSRHWVPGHWR